MTSSNSDKLVTVIGGSGFVGRYIVRALARRGYRVRVASRRPDLAGFVTPSGVVGQVVNVQANVRYPASIAAACDGAYAVVNCAVSFHDGSAQSFHGVNVFGAEAVAKAAKAAKAQVLIQMSGVGVDAEHSPSAYVQSRHETEKVAKAAFSSVTFLRPSVVFGPEDKFLNKFANLARFSPIMPVVASNSKLQPVYVGDVAEAAAVLIDRGMADGKTYELGGPEIKTMSEIVNYVLGVTQRRRLVFPLPNFMAKTMAIATGWLPGAPLTADQVELLKLDAIVSPQAETESRTLKGLGITPRSIEAIAPSYLYRYRKAGQFTGEQAVR